MFHFLSSATPIPPKTVAKSSEKPDEQVPNLDFEAWVAKDQQILNYLLSSLSRDVLAQVAALPTAATVWEAIEGMFASQSRARVINTRMALANAQKGSSSIAKYFTKMKTLANDMASARSDLTMKKLCRTSSRASTSSTILRCRLLQPVLSQTPFVE